ncbi:hypothetical protein KAX01_03255 [Candidatus Bathyarchaeota archaeon]|nr:hypothetical protein [Candidatus Bathyarchaeota archaeon]
MGKVAITAPLYISVAWSLIVSYQLFTQTAVYSVVSFLDSFWGSASQLLIPRIATIVFIHAFAWIFVLSSVIPSILLGKSRSVLLQFFLCLTLTLVATSVEGMLMFMMGNSPVIQVEALSPLFQNPILAGIYLSVPYILMLYLDIHSRRSGKTEAEKSETTVLDDVAVDEEDVASEEEVLLVEDDVLIEEEIVYNAEIEE